ncbi:hypothetical protein KP509_06G070300 [Ceratopteris richardii]|uniref:Uncharacterized protein n=1 Tax=Ceratopteris richardii TaxID=49495 RepID=A0A8T2UHJ2_CERRI|nr:hypothetical protein KP509_06G070300 [Ceratopteris richardii]
MTRSRWRNSRNSWGRRLGGLSLLALTSGFAASSVDDILVYQQCSRKALKTAECDKRIQELLGDAIQQGGWREATIGFAHHGQCVSCSFPLYGSHGTAEIKLKAVRTQSRKNNLTF